MSARTHMLHCVLNQPHEGYLWYFKHPHLSLMTLRSQIDELVWFLFFVVEQNLTYFDWASLLQREKNELSLVAVPLAVCVYSFVYFSWLPIFQQRAHKVHFRPKTQSSSYLEPQIPWWSTLFVLLLQHVSPTVTQWCYIRTCVSINKTWENCVSIQLCFS